MNNAPIVLICGEAGKGKDTVAGIIQKLSPSTQALAQADPMKRFCAQIFGFTEDQLWGPSESRNAVDQRFADIIPWIKADEAIAMYGKAWCRSLLDDEKLTADAYDRLYTWFAALKEAHAPNRRERPEPRRDLSPRIALQLIGTEWGRYVDEDMWARYAVKTARKLLSGKHYYDRRLGALPYKADTKIPEFVLVTDGRFPNEVAGMAAAAGHRLLVTGPVVSALAGGVPGHSSESLLSQIPRHWFTAELYNDKQRGFGPLEASVERYYRSITQVERFGSSAGHNLH